jgi:hypothetical protein
VSHAANRVNREGGLTAPIGGGSGELLGHGIIISSKTATNFVVSDYHQGLSARKT